MSSTQEKLIDKYSNPEWWKQNPEATKDDWWRYFSEDVPITLEEARHLIDSAKREGYKQGYIDAGIKEITEGASKDLFQELLLYKAAYGELPLEQSEESE